MSLAFTATATIKSLTLGPEYNVVFWAKQEISMKDFIRNLLVALVCYKLSNNDPRVLLMKLLASFEEARGFNGIESKKYVSTMEKSKLRQLTFENGADIMFIGEVISMRHLCESVIYVMTNTDLAENDPRQDFVKLFKKVKQKRNRLIIQG